jgi:hypothetical protein
MDPTEEDDDHYSRIAVALSAPIGTPAPLPPEIGPPVSGAVTSNRIAAFAMSSVAASSPSADAKISGESVAYYWTLTLRLFPVP